MISAKDQSALKHLWQSEAYQSLIALVEEQIILWSKLALDRSSEWSFIQSELLREGKVEGVKTLLNAIERVASEKHL